MRGNPKVIEQLNLALREELTAINQYFIHAEMCDNWGYLKLGAFIKKQSIDEMRHAETLIERLLFLDATPTMQPMDLSVGSTVTPSLSRNAGRVRSVAAAPALTWAFHSSAVFGITFQSGLSGAAISA